MFFSAGGTGQGSLTAILLFGPTEHNMTAFPQFDGSATYVADSGLIAAVNASITIFTQTAEKVRGEKPSSPQLSDISACEASN